MYHDQLIHLCSSGEACYSPDMPHSTWMPHEAHAALVTPCMSHAPSQVSSDHLSAAVSGMPGLAMAKAPAVLDTIRGVLKQITLQYPERRNALSSAMVSGSPAICQLYRAASLPILETI